MKEFAFKPVDTEGEDTLNTIVFANHLNSWMYNSIKQYCQGKILEIGSGDGNISEYFLKDNSTILITDIREVYCESLREKFAGSNTFLGIYPIWLRASVHIMIPSSSEKDDAMLVIGIDDEKHDVFKYNVSKSSETNYKPGEWFELSFTDIVDKNTPVNGTYKAYVWYNGKNKIYVDDLKLEWMPVGF